jgi:spore coat polysaccharide biosynthesis protein SpsF
MPKVVACIIARTVSKRLPLKILRDLAPGLSMIELLIQRVKTVSEIDEIYLCTSQESVDDILEDVAARNGIKLYRGSADAVIERMLAVGEIEKADVLLRITGDNPLASVEYIPQQLSLLLRNKLDYTRVIDVPIGATTEVMTTEALKRCYATMDPGVSEYLMLFIFEPKHFKCGIIKAFQNDYSNYSVTVDTPDDLIRTKGILKLLSQDPEKILLKDIIGLYTDKNVQLPAMIIKSGGSIKYPYEKVISFEEFNQDMKRRKENSTIVKLYE